MECRACGADTESGFNFCTNCGTTLREESDMPPPTPTPLAVEAGRRAHERFTSKGAAGYLQLFGDIWPLGQTAAG